MGGDGEDEGRFSFEHVHRRKMMIVVNLRGQPLTSCCWICSSLNQYVMREW
jgi:hypothetical protein